MSLAAVPVYLLARRLSLGAGYALACSVFTVALPDLSSRGTRWPTRSPSRSRWAARRGSRRGRRARPASRTAAFFVLAGLATFARASTSILPVAFLVGGARSSTAARSCARSACRSSLLALPLLAVLASAPRTSSATTRTSSTCTSADAFCTGHWSTRFCSRMSSGVVLLPGALVALARPRGRAETSFAALASGFAAGLFFEAALYASNGSERFQERYLFALLPLLPIAFGLYLKHGRPARVAVAAASLGVLRTRDAVPALGLRGCTRQDRLAVPLGRLPPRAGDRQRERLARRSLLAAVGRARRGRLVSRLGGGRYAARRGDRSARCHLGRRDVPTTREQRAQVRHDYVPSNPSWVDAHGLQE